MRTDLVNPGFEQTGHQIMLLDANTGAFDFDAAQPSATGWARLEAHIIIAEYLAGFGLTELMLLFSPVSGGLLYCVWLVVLLLHCSWHATATTYRRVLAALLLIPLLRLLSLTMPLAGLPIFFWYILVGIPLLVAVIPLARLLALSPVALGLGVQQWPLQMLFTALGIPLAIAAFWILPAAPILASVDWDAIGIGTLVLFIFTGFTQELVFRGVIQGVMKESFGSNAAIIYTTILFTTMYIGVGSLAYLGFSALLGLLLGWWRDYTGSIWGGAMAHGLMNTWILVILPLVASGGAG